VRVLVTGAAGYIGGLLVPRLLEHLASRQATGDRLREGAVPVTELRAAIVVEIAGGGDAGGGRAAA
jgi:uncharacterized protein YbjT (DUF2867 family)